MRQRPHGDTFSHNTINGSNNRVHFGHNFYAGDPQESPLDSICELLYLTDPRIDRQSLLETKHGIVEGTCEWLLQHEKLQRWSTLTGNENTAPPGLWVSREPGKGKTMLAIYISQVLEHHCKPEQDRSLLYYFCVHNNDKQNTPLTILRSWIRQLLKNEPELFQHVSDRFQTDTLENLVALWDIFLTLVKNSVKKAIFCILDGLDECKQQLEHFVSQIHSYCQPNKLSDQGKLRLMVFSRETQICNFNEQDSFDRINLDTDANQQVKDSIFLFLEQRGISRDLARSSHEAFMEKLKPLLNGQRGQTFLWIGYIAKELQKCKTMKEINKKVRRFPQGLDETYKRMVEQIHQADLDQGYETSEPPEKTIEATRKLLQWVVLARRPLTLRETAVILGIIPEEVRDRITQYGDILEVKDTKVELLHKSAGDFLSRGAEFSNKDLEQYRVRTQEAHNAIATFCLTMIEASLRRYPSLGIDEAQTISILEKQPLLEYAILYWPGHLAEAETVGRTVLDSLPVITQKKLRSRWWTCYWHLTPHDRFLPTSFSLLHLAAYFCLQELARTELDASKSTHIFSRPINRRDSHGRTPLSWAAERGHLEIVKLLLKNNADKEICEVGGGRALNRSFHSGRPDVIKRLIDAGAETDYRFRLPFESARTGEQWGKLDKEWSDLRLLDRNGIQAVCLRNVRFVLPLSLLPMPLLVVSMILVIINGNSRGALFWTVTGVLILGAILPVACVTMYMALMWHTGIALFRVMDLMPEIIWLSPLTWCIYTCPSEITDLFLKDMSQPKFKLRDGRTPLSHAAQAGNFDLVDHILDTGAEVNETEADYITRKLHGSLDNQISDWCWDKLTQPIYSQAEDMHTQRWRERARRFARGKWGNACTAFARAAQGPRESRVRLMTLLLERGAKTDSQDVWGQTPLFYAAGEGNEDAARLLLEQGNVDVNHLSHLQETPLSVAVSSGHQQLAKFLVAKGAKEYA